MLNVNRSHWPLVFPMEPLLELENTVLHGKDTRSAPHDLPMYSPSLRSVVRFSNERGTKIYVYSKMSGHKDLSSVTQVLKSFYNLL